jgi:hypothetical protein
MAGLEMYSKVAPMGELVGTRYRAAGQKRNISNFT